MDGVIYDFHSAFRFLAQHQFKLVLPTVDLMWPRWDGHLRYMTKEQNDWMWTKGVDHGLFRHGHVRKGAVEATRAIDEIADIVIITHRPRTARQDTIDWLSFHRIPVAEVHLLSDNEPKSSVECDLYLDDKDSNVLEISMKRPDSMSIVWDRAWNRVMPDGVYERAYSWADVINFVRTQWLSLDRTRRI